MGDDATGEGLVRVLQDLPVPTPGLDQERRIACLAEGRDEALRSFDSGGRASEAARGQQRGGEPAARGIAGIKRLAHRATGLAQPAGLRRRDAQRPGNLPFIQPEREGACRRRAERGHRSGRRPCEAIGRGARIEQARLELDAQHQRMQQRAPVDRPDLGQREQRTGDRRRRMQHDMGMRIVEVEDVAADAVDQRGVQAVHACRVADHRGLRRTRELSGHRHCMQHGSIAAAAECGAQPVQHRAPRLM